MTYRKLAVYSVITAPMWVGIVTTLCLGAGVIWAAEASHRLHHRLVITSRSPRTRGCGRRVR